jgi:hypothetical protein
LFGDSHKLLLEKIQGQQVIKVKKIGLNYFVNGCRVITK